MNVKLRTKKLKDGGVSYYLDIYLGPKNRIYEFLGIKTVMKGPSKDTPIQRKEKKRLAESIAAHKEIEILSHNSNTTFTPKHIKNMSFFDFADNFILNYPKRDIRIVASALNKFKEFSTNDNIKITDVTPHMMEQYKEHLIKDPALSGETPHNYFTRFKKILRSAKRHGLIKEMPTSDIIFSNPGKENSLSKEVLEMEELRILSKTHCGNEEVKKAFLFCCYTGLGLSEIRKLTWSHIKGGRLNISRSKTNVRINNGLNTAAIRLIGETGDPSETVFGINGISDNAVNKNLKNWLKRAEIDKKITFYCARHSFACLLLMNGANLKSVADAMGHTSTKTTLKYLNHVERLKDDAINNIPDLEL
jgi:integrase